MTWYKTKKISKDFKETFDCVHACSHAAQHGIQSHQSCHGFHYYHGSGHDNGIMAAFDRDFNILALAVYCFLDSGHGRVGLKAARIRIGAPSLIPPVMPPEWFVFFIHFPPVHAVCIIVM